MFLLIFKPSGSMFDEKIKFYYDFLCSYFIENKVPHKLSNKIIITPEIKKVYYFDYYGFSRHSFVEREGLREYLKNVTLVSVIGKERFSSIENMAFYLVYSYPLKKNTLFLYKKEKTEEKIGPESLMCDFSHSTLKNVTNKNKNNCGGLITKDRSSFMANEMLIAGKPVIFYNKNITKEKIMRVIDNHKPIEFKETFQLLFENVSLDKNVKILTSSEKRKKEKQTPKRFFIKHKQKNSKKLISSH